MARISIENTTDYYDDELDVVIDKYGDICSSVPEDTFAFGDKIYTFGTVVTLCTHGRTFEAVFEKGKYGNTFQGKEERQFETIYGDFHIWGNNTYVKEIKKEVLFTPSLPKEKESPPTAVGYKTVEYKDPRNPAKTTYRDHLYGCVVDGNGNIVLHNVLDNNFGFRKHVFAPGTKVVVRESAGDKRFNTKKAPDIDSIEKKYVYYNARWDGIYYRFEGSLVPHDKEVRRSSCYGQPERIGSMGGMTIVYISEPHYYRPIPRNITAWDHFKLNGGNAPVDTSVGTIWYIVIMVVATIFKARIGIWIITTIAFLLWKYGYMNKK